MKLRLKFQQQYRNFLLQLLFTEQLLMKSTRFLCLAMIIKYASKTMVAMDQPLVIRVNQKKTVILVTIQKSFFVKHICFNFFSSQNSFFIKHIVLISSLIRTAFFEISKNIDRLLTWHIKYEKCKALKKDKSVINANSVTFEKMVEFFYVRR